MAIPKVTGYTGVIPDRRTQSAEDFTSAAVTWTDYQASTLVPSTNAAIDGINAAQDEILDSVNNAEESSFIAQAAANYQGPWFSGAQVVKGESWSHNGLMWAANVTGADEPQENAQWFLLKSEPELSAIKVMLEQWGYRYVGLFDDGFTYSQVGDAGVDGNNNAWVYVGAGAPNKVVGAGAVPSTPDYEKVDFNYQHPAKLIEGTVLSMQQNLGLKAGDIVETVNRAGDYEGSTYKIVDDASAYTIDSFINLQLYNDLWAIDIANDVSDSSMFNFAGTEACGHRGASALAPENSISSMSMARKVGFNFVELDLLPNADGEMVCIHDATVDRTTNGTGNVIDLTTAQLKALDMKYSTLALPIIGNFFNDYFGGEKIPTFTEVCQEAKRSKLGLVLEVKLFSEPEREDFYSSVLEFGIIDQVLLQSTQWDIINSFRAMNKNIPVGFISPVGGSINRGDIDRCALVKNCWFNADATKITKSDVNYAHSKKVKVMVYTANTATNFDKFKSWGVNLILSDYIGA